MPRGRRSCWAILDGYDVPTRYPNTLPDSIPARVYTEPAAREAVALAAEVVRFVAERLGLTS
jgi:HEPN domain-containing protein